MTAALAVANACLHSGADDDDRKELARFLPRVLRGERVLVSAHGNSLRALVMVLERLSREEILKREIGTGVPLIYRLSADSTVASKLDLAA